MDPQARRFLPESLCSAATKATISQTPNMEPKESKELRTEQKKISPRAALLGSVELSTDLREVSQCLRRPLLGPSTY